MLTSMMSTNYRIGIIGAGAAGLITAHALLQDGFLDVEILTRDPSPGGVWSADRVYPGLTANNIYGEFRFSSLPMPPSRHAKSIGGRLSGEDLRSYMESFADRFLSNKIRYSTEVLNIRPGPSTTSSQISGRTWFVTVEDINSGSRRCLEYDKIVLCTGGCSEPHIPPLLSPMEAKSKGFRGLVIHSSQFRARLDDILNVRLSTSVNNNNSTILVVGGGKSGQDIATYLANQGKQVNMVFSRTDAAMAAPFPYPQFIRRSRLLSVLSPHIELRTRLERFLHSTWTGGKIVRGIWQLFHWMTLKVLSIPKDSPLRRAPDMFWTVHGNDEGMGLHNGFYSLVNQGLINLIAPAHAVSFAEDGESVVLDDRRLVKADVVILATGQTSSWKNIFDQTTMEELGLSRHPVTFSPNDYEWDYASLSDPPATRSKDDLKVPSIYRGIVPAKNILHRDLAVNGAILTSNNGYVFEVVAHWIASYFRADKFLYLPGSPDEAYAATERNTAWLIRRYPNTFLTVNESYSSDLAFWSWPQLADTLLEDMQLPAMRSGGSWFMWPFKVIEPGEIEHLGRERAELRAQF